MSTPVFVTFATFVDCYEVAVAVVGPYVFTKPVPGPELLKFWQERLYNIKRWEIHTRRTDIQEIPTDGAE